MSDEAQIMTESSVNFPGNVGKRMNDQYRELFARKQTSSIEYGTAKRGSRTVRNGLS